MEPPLLHREPLLIGLSGSPLRVDDLAVAYGYDDAASHGAVRANRCGFFGILDFQRLSVRGNRLETNPQTAHCCDSAGKFQETSSADVHEFCLLSSEIMHIFFMLFLTCNMQPFPLSHHFQGKLRKTKANEHYVFRENNALTALSLYIQHNRLSTQKCE